MTGRCTLVSHSRQWKRFCSRATVLSVLPQMKKRTTFCCAQVFDTRQTQQTMDRFLSFNHRFAKIGSKRMQVRPSSCLCCFKIYERSFFFSLGAHQRVSFDSKFELLSPFCMACQSIHRRTHQLILNLSTNTGWHQASLQGARARGLCAWHAWQCHEQRRRRAL